MPDFAERDRIDARVLEFHGQDPFAEVVRIAEEHRASHGPACGLYPAGPQVMRLAAALVSASGAKRILDIGTGIGYSALWLARAAGEGAVVEAMDRFPEHVEIGRRIVAEAGLADRIRFLTGEADELLPGLAGPYDAIHDDGWFAAKPAYYERVIELLRPGGLLTMPNWFLLEDALSGTPRRDWAEFAGAAWREATIDYARRIASDRRLTVTWSFVPPLGIAVKLRGIELANGDDGRAARAKER